MMNNFIQIKGVVCSDYGFELNGEDCVAASWFNASIPIGTCEVGSKYLNSSGSGYFLNM